MAESKDMCFICKTYDEFVTLKPLKDRCLKTAKNADERRKSLKQDKYATITIELLSPIETEGRYYHSQCLSRYCAVKRPQAETELSERPRKSTRTTINLPSTDNKGILGEQCVFCGNARKR